MTKSELNVQQRTGWLNRHTTPLPDHKCIITILVKDVDGLNEYLCTWFPYSPDVDLGVNTPAEGFIGTARVRRGLTKRFHAWGQGNSEFIYYKLL